MKIFKINSIQDRTTLSNTKQRSKNDPTYKSNSYIQNTFAYQDFNINFQGRTPENFYQQIFNINNMPKTMKTFLYNNYNTRRHIPPEQIMSESFKFLQITNNFSDVKSMYPEEPLFEKLHEPSKKIRRGIIAEINTAKSIEDLPLLKDGGNDLGIYLLRKMLLEGKTIKEINKDFFEKDINPAYIGVITQPIDYTTTFAYGIQYPKTDFWHSFIATRDEYKKFFVELPKQNRTELEKEAERTKKYKPKTEDTNKNTTVKNKLPIRKFSIKPFQKDKIEKDIKNTKYDTSDIEKIVRKTFTKDDPEASFIVKYLSPIMIIAADRIHLSEEERDFAEKEKSEGKKIEDLFAKFWKAKPELAELYSTAITDTIELFEEIYSAGGMIAINNEFKPIDNDTENNKAIDFVSKEFIELLNHSKEIVETRNKNLEKHNELQDLWNEHFLWRYGEVIATPEKVEEKIIPDNQSKEKVDQTVEDMIKNTAKEHDCNVIELKGKNGEKIDVVGNLDEAYKESIYKDFLGFPPAYINSCIRKTLNHPMMSDKFKLSILCSEYYDQIDDDRIYPKEELEKIVDSMYDLYSKDLYIIARTAAQDIYATKLSDTNNVYRYFTNINYNSDNRTQIMQEINQYSVEHPEIATELNQRYISYRQPLSNNEKNKIIKCVINYINNFREENGLSKDSLIKNNPGIIRSIILMRDRMQHDKTYERFIKDNFLRHINKYPYARNILMDTNNQVLCNCQINTLLISLIQDLDQVK